MIASFTPRANHGQPHTERWQTGVPRQPLLYLSCIAIVVASSTLLAVIEEPGYSMDIVLASGLDSARPWSSLVGKWQRTIPKDAYEPGHSLSSCGSVLKVYIPRSLHRLLARICLMLPVATSAEITLEVQIALALALARHYAATREYSDIRPPDHTERLPEELLAYIFEWVSASRPEWDREFCQESFPIDMNAIITVNKRWRVSRSEHCRFL